MGPAPGSRGTASPTSPTSRDGPAASSNAPYLSPDAAARTRMRECGHQWSSMKKAGNTGTMTWKDFSVTCLAVK